MFKGRGKRLNVVERLGMVVLRSDLDHRHLLKGLKDVQGREERLNIEKGTFVFEERFIEFSCFRGYLFLRLKLT